MDVNLLTSLGISIPNEMLHASRYLFFNACRSVKMMMSLGEKANGVRRENKGTRGVWWLDLGRQIGKLGKSLFSDTV